MNPFPRDHRTIVNNGSEKRPNGIVVTVKTGLALKLVANKPSRLTTS